ncbi:MAG: DUF711 family protein [Candidatus Uhrbacteria bacterium]
MKIRTITTGLMLKSIKETQKNEQVAEFNRNAKDAFVKAGYEVQTTRIATNSWEDYTIGLSDQEIVSEIVAMEAVAIKQGVSFLNIGYSKTPKKTLLISEINKNTSIISTSAKVADKKWGINFENIKASAQVIKKISKETENGYGNFRFCAAANCQPGIPFFPAGYHEGNKSVFGIGLESGDLVMKAFSKSSDLIEAEYNLKEIFETELVKVEKIAQEISKEFGVVYNGIDSSINPGLEKSESVAFAFEKLGIEKFGDQGTLAIATMVTRVLKDLDIKLCGYSGLMLPICEDVGLAQRANEETYNLSNVLLYSAVCGCGYDTVPIPGDISEETIESIILDVASLATRLDKPLSARLLPVPNKKAGEMTNFQSPYMVDCKILKVN